MDSLYLTQAVYRELLECMSRPGTVRVLPDEIQHLWDSGLAAIAATLVDNEVQFCVLDDDRTAERIEEVSHGKKAACDRADFIFVPDGDSCGMIRQAKRGLPEYPDMGATVIYQADLLVASSHKKDISMKGPGIKDEVYPVISGIPGNELAALNEINSEYPLGIDVFIVDRDNRVMAIPRSVKVECSLKTPEKKGAV